jgi:molybdenum cofactor cytidylyltransferase
VSNPEFEKGQTSSVIAGMNSVKKHANAAMILPGDLAFIKPEQIDKVIDEYNLAPSSIVVASYRGRMGHPILFDHALFDEMLKITEEKAGLKEVVNRHRSEIRRIEVESREILVDIDIPYDLRSLEKEKGPKTV